MKNENGEWKETDSEIQEVITDYFQNLFASTSIEVSMPTRIEFPVLSEVQRQVLGIPIVVEEVKNAVIAMHSDKSPGIDGLNPSFYHVFPIYFSRMIATSSLKQQKERHEH